MGACGRFLAQSRACLVVSLFGRSRHPPLKILGTPLNYRPLFAVISPAATFPVVCFFDLYNSPYYIPYYTILYPLTAHLQNLGRVKLLTSVSSRRKKISNETMYLPLAFVGHLSILISISFCVSVFLIRRFVKVWTLVFLDNLVFNRPLTNL